MTGLSTSRGEGWAKKAPHGGDACSRAWNDSADPTLERSDDDMTLLADSDLEMILESDGLDEFDTERPACPRCASSAFEYDPECKAHVCDGCGLWLDDDPLDDWTF